ncbi:MAG: short-chain dehydrogenase, partial [bacterium]
GMADSKLLKGQKMMDAQTVAWMGYDALMRGQTIVIPGLLNQILAKSVRFFPRKMVTKIVRSMQENN